MLPARRSADVKVAVLALGVALAAGSPSLAQDSWSRPRPGESTRPAPAREQGVSPSRPSPPAWGAPRASTVERSELAPIMAPDASGLPLELWRGLDLKSLEELLTGLELPPRSPAVHQMWRRLLLASATPPDGAPNAEHFVALRLEALYRSGLIGDMETVLNAHGAGGPIVDLLRARRQIGIGRREDGCRTIKALSVPGSALPGRLKGEAQLLAGYCAAVAGDAHAAGLAAELAREEGVEADLPLAVLAGVADGTKPKLALPQRVLLLDYRFLELLGPVDALQVFDKAEPALLTVLAGDTGADARVQIAAAEASLRLNALSPETVAEVYRRQSLPQVDHADPTARGADPLLRRALYFKAIEVARAPDQRARFLRAILDDARRSGFLAQMARVVSPQAESLRPSPSVAAFAETGIEVALSADRFDQARRWAEVAGLHHWLALIDVADPARRGGRPPSLRVMEDLAARGQLSPATLHRLATVLDALDIDVPIGLWDAASRTPQPATGYLPETGVLAALAQAAASREVGRTMLLVMRSLGPGGPEGANVLALGDAVRALKRAGLEADARRLGVEALLAVWPRRPAN